MNTSLLTVLLWTWIVVAVVFLCILLSLHLERAKEQPPLTRRQRIAAVLFAVIVAALWPVAWLVSVVVLAFHRVVFGRWS